MDLSLMVGWSRSQARQAAGQMLRGNCDGAYGRHGQNLYWCLGTSWRPKKLQTIDGLLENPMNIMDDLEVALFQGFKYGFHYGFIGLNFGLIGLNFGFIGFNYGLIGFNYGFIGLNYGLLGFYYGFIGFYYGLADLYPWVK